MATSHFPLPDVGEGLTEAEIVAWRVRPGDPVTMNQVIVEIETAKSLVELPSPFAGTVSALLVDEGATVEVGTDIIAIDTAGGAPAAPTRAPSATAVDGVVADAAADTAATVSKEESPANLVGYGAKTHGVSRRRKPAERPAPAPVPAQAVQTAPAAAVAPSVQGGPAGGPVLAKPPVRRLAKDLGVNLAAVTPTGPANDVTREDVLRSSQQVSVFRNVRTPDWPAEREERIPVKGVRKAIAKAMVDSAFTAPHVSVFVDVDATRTMEFVRRLKNSADFAGVKVSPLLIMAKAIIWAVRRNPTVNSTWTDEEIIIHHFVNLGIAAATPRGLIVPNVKDAHTMSLLNLAQALEQLTVTAREGKTQPAEMADGTITITNLGSFGMDTGTPILNPGEVSIVALGTIKQKPWVVDGEVLVRSVATLGASFDHRVVDGDVASRFLADVASIVEEPALLLD
ncbi:dihydrolipoamide acetyltransferase family protein [Lysobacter korlensis]|uniref:Dihydrolipoamide acetyltransferase component of pyruvate dehydrogenase complex n=1 Tax=Lysobacter korlensis TaxID=553636 RepID=A0ABV6RVB7_9GAMM